jgi:photosystem II stability/assembly factor-like uncharacterized protein
MRRINPYLSVILGLGVVLLIVTSPAAQIKDSLDDPAIQIKDPARAVLLSIAKAGNRLVAVGERGIVITSDDGGKNWKQAVVPSSDSITAVKFVSPTVGWAAGHSGLVLHTEDGGQTWTRQLDGRMAAQLASDAVKVRFQGKTTPEAIAQLQNAERMVQEGPDKPFLDLYFEDAQKGIVVGAYGMIVCTKDGGKTWTSWMDRLDNPEGHHLYAVAEFGNNIYIAGEQGLIFQSSDSGKHFKKIASPYAGTFFSLAITPNGEVILTGMKGTILRFNGRTFTKVQSPNKANLSATTWLSDGSLLFLNQAGQMLISHDQGKTIEPIAVPPLPPSGGMVDAGDGRIWTVGVSGVIPVPLAMVRAAVPQGEAQ